MTSHLCARNLSMHCHTHTTKAQFLPDWFGSERILCTIFGVFKILFQTSTDSTRWFSAVITKMFLCELFFEILKIVEKKIITVLFLFRGFKPIPKMALTWMAVAFGYLVGWYSKKKLYNDHSLFTIFFISSTKMWFDPHTSKSFFFWCFSILKRRVKRWFWAIFGQF